MAGLRFFILDDHQIFRAGLRLILERAPGLEFVGEAGDGATALPLIAAAHPDIVLADIHLADEDGIGVALKIRAQDPKVRVVFLSSDSTLAMVHRALDADCSGFVRKENAPQEVLRAIETASQGGIYLCPEVASAVLRGYRPPPGGTTSAIPATLVLSGREEEVLRLVAEGLRNKEIADRLQIGVKSVETYRSRLLHKLGYDSTAQLVRHAIREGLIKA